MMSVDGLMVAVREMRFFEVVVVARERAVARARVENARRDDVRAERR